MCPRSSLVVLTLCALLGLDASPGQDSVKKAAPGALPAGSVEVRFTDGGCLRMVIAEEHLELVTAHGKLKIAVASIRRLDLATRFTESTQRLIEQSVADLGSPQFRLRQKASAELLALREKAYPAVLKVSQSRDTEIAKRARELLEKIRATVPANRLLFREKDVVHTVDSTITGRLDLASLAATTQQFGTVQLKLADVAAMHFLASGAETELKLDGRYAISNEVWLDTEIDVTEFVRLTITASGEIDLYATGGYHGQYVGTPKGKKAWPGSTGGPYEPGTLIGRIGENGKVFAVKDLFEEPAPASGRLYLRAAGNPYNVQTAGHYTIKIQGGVPGVGAATKPAGPPDTPDAKDAPPKPPDRTGFKELGPRPRRPRR